MSARRADTSAAVAGLFERVSATGGLAGRDDQAEATIEGPATRRNRTPDERARNGGPAHEAVAPQVTRVRLGVELAEVETAYLRSLSRPALTGSPRTLGSKFVATGLLAAAIELLHDGAIDMHGVAAGDLPEMTARARAALIRAAQTQPSREDDR
jgi:hypothetical protein